jgi:hypothetical protein
MRHSGARENSRRRRVIEVKDSQGVVLKAGDVIVYPVRTGSYTLIRRAVISKVTSYTRAWVVGYKKDDSGRYLIPYEPNIEEKTFPKLLAEIDTEKLNWNDEKKSFDRTPIKKLVPVTAVHRVTKIG